MDIQKAYDAWSDQYDGNENKTRDLEAVALRNVLNRFSFSSCLEMGCGTGKNTEWFVTQCDRILAVDLSAEMMAKAKEKVRSEKVEFILADMSSEWNFTNKKFELISFSLVLEHIENLHFIFREAAKALSPGGYVYVGELHPFKQYTGTKARFETENGTQVLTCFDHHISDFTDAAFSAGFEIELLKEFFDEEEKFPRILVLVFKKSAPQTS